MQQCFGEMFSFSLGLRLSDGEGGYFLLRARLGSWIQDMEAHREVCDIKGASGTKFCPWCKNMTKGVKKLKPSDYE